MKHLKRFNEQVTDSKAILIRSKTDKMFRYEVHIDQNNKIFKIESQGDLSDKMYDKKWVDFVIKICTGTIMDYDFLRDFQAKTPELYVEDIV